MTCFIGYNDLAFAVAHYTAIGALVFAVLGAVTWVAAGLRVPHAWDLLHWPWLLAGACFAVMSGADAVYYHPLASLCAACALGGVFLGLVLGRSGRSLT